MFDKSLYFGRFRGVLEENKEFDDLCYGEVDFFDAQYFGFFKDNEFSGPGTLITKNYSANGIFEAGKFVRGTIHMLQDDYCIVLEHANEDGTWSGAVFYESGTWMQGIFSSEGELLDGEVMSADDDVVEEVG